MKMLRAFGPKGRAVGGKTWNWCDEAELVGIHGSMCCSSKTCGCGLSFNGISSAKSCSRAEVIDVTFDEFMRQATALYNTTMKDWGNNTRIADEAVCQLFLLASLLGDYTPGTVLFVNKTKGVELIAA
jgi:hypothetical protein